MPKSEKESVNDIKPRQKSSAGESSFFVIFEAVKDKGAKVLSLVKNPGSKFIPKITEAVFPRLAKIGSPIFLVLKKFWKFMISVLRKVGAVFSFISIPQKIKDLFRSAFTKTGQFFNWVTAKRKRSIAFSTGLIALILPLLYLTFRTPGEVKAAPWSKIHTDYTQRKRLTLINNSGQTLPAGTTYKITLDTQALVESDALLSTCDDLRVLYQPNNDTAIELNRNIEYVGGGTCASSNASHVVFQLQENISDSAKDLSYYLYFGNSRAEAYPEANALAAYDIGDAQATFVAPFRGTTEALAAGSGTPTTEEGAIRFGEVGSAMEFSTRGDRYISLGCPASLQNLLSGSVTYEFWIYYKEDVSRPYNYLLGNNSGSSNSGPMIYFRTQNRRINFRVYTQEGYASAESNSGAFYLNTWTHLAFTYDSEGDRVPRIFVDGTEVSYNRQDVAEGDPVDETGCNYTIPGSIWTGEKYFQGYMDEIRISNTIRYTENFTPQTTPFVRDEHTQLLLHFNEGGDDPRNPGFVIDDSGNGNHGTIVGGAKHVSGIVGIENSTDDSGHIPAHSYASHQGVFVEEGTVNKITNPSFEHETFDTNWEEGVNEFSTFTPGVAKRAGEGPFAAGVMIQNDPDNDSIGDRIFVEDIYLSNISGQFHENFDQEQGSIVFWWTPEFGSSDISSTNHFYLFHVNNRFFLRYRYSDNSFEWRAGSTVSSIQNHSISAGVTYLVTLRWDFNNYLTGTDYSILTVGSSSYSGITSIDSISAIDLHIGSGTGGTSANALIEGFTVYRRPLFDGTNGIDVGNGNELSQIYNSDDGWDPVLVTGSWDVVFALPTNASTGELTTGTGEAWTHPHSSNLLYTSTTNTGGFMMNGTYTNDGWSDEGTPTNVEALDASERIFAGGYKWTNDAAQEGLYHDISVTPGDAFVIRAIAHSDGTAIPEVIFYDQTNDVEISSLTGTTTSTRTTPDVFIFTGEAPAGCEIVRVKIINTESSGTVYWHQVEVLENLFDSPSMERGTGDPWILDGWTNHNIGAGESAQVSYIQHSGSYSLSYIWDGNYTGLSQYRSIPISLGSFYAAGGFFRSFTHNIGNLDRQAGLRFPDMGHQSGADLAHHFGTTFGVRGVGSPGVWLSGKGVGIANSDSSEVRIMAVYYGADTYYYDDIFFFPLDDVPITVISATAAESIENDRIRVDGADTYTHTLPTLTTTVGNIEFEYVPRYDAANVTNFGEATPHIAEFYGDSENYIKLYWSAANTITLMYDMDNSGEVSDTWDATGAISAGTPYAMEISYTGEGDMTLVVDGVTRITLSSIPEAFGTVPATAYWGSDSLGTQQGDAVFLPHPLNSEENTDIPYSKFGEKSARLQNSGGDGRGFVTSVNTETSRVHTLSAYVYDGTSGNVGGTVDSDIAELIFNGAVQTTNYVNMGGGWWRLWYSGYPGFSEGYDEANLDSDQGLYTDDSTEFLSQGFQLNESVPIDFLYLRLNRVGSAGWVQVEIQTDSGGVPSGTTFTNGVSVCTGGYRPVYHTYRFDFQDHPVLSPDTPYHIVLKSYTDHSCTTPRTAPDPANYWIWGYDGSSSSYVYGDRATYDGTSWTTYSGEDHIFMINGYNSQDFGLQVAAGKTIYFDGVQIEEKYGTHITRGGYGADDYITTYMDGSMGEGYSWSGTPHNSSSVRIGSRLRYDYTDNISASEGSLSFWVKVPYTQKGGPWNRGGTYFSTNGLDGMRIFHQSDADNTHCSFGDSHVSWDSVNPNTWYMVSVVWSGTSFSCYLNANQEGTGESSSPVAIGTMDVGGGLIYGHYTYGSATISNLRIYNSALTSTQVAGLYYSGLGSHMTDAVPTQRFAYGDPTLAWRFDEGSGSIAHDSTINQKHGVISGAVWSDDTIAGGSSSKSLRFNGVDSYVSRPYNKDSELDPSTEPFAVSAWFKRAGDITDTETIVSRHNTAGYKLYMNSSGNICFGIDDDSTWGPDNVVCTAESYADNNWHHVLAVKGDSNIEVFIDGIQRGSTPVTVTGSLTGRSQTFYVGIDSDGTSNLWNGFIDMVRFYNKARTEENARQEFIARGSVLGVAAQFGKDDTESTLRKGLIGYWKMDEESWDGTAGEVIDSSGNENHGTAMCEGEECTVPTTSAGRFGRGGESFSTFDGYLDIPYESNLAISNEVTISAWVNMTDYGAWYDHWIMHKGSGIYVNYHLKIREQSGYFPEFSFTTSDSTSHTWRASTGISTDVWTHVTISYRYGDGNSIRLYVDGSHIEGSWISGNGNVFPYIGNENLYIGGFQNSYNTSFLGSLDEIRIYNRALSSAEIRALYEWAPGPISRLKFDEGSGTTARDSGVNPNDATLSSNIEWTMGRFGRAIELLSSDSVVNVGSDASINNPYSWTMSAWVNPRTVNPGYASRIIQKGVLNSQGRGINLLSTGELEAFQACSGTDALTITTSTLPENSWSYVTAVYNDFTRRIEIYINGVKQTYSTYQQGDSSSSTSDESSYDLLIGNRLDLDRGFPGIIDDFVHYDYDRTQKQIVSDMNAGHPVPGSPIGSPLIHFKFDEGYGGVVHNHGSGGASYNAYLAGPSTNCPGASTCPTWIKSGKFDGALSFDGAADPDGDWATVDLPDLIGSGKGSFAISAWLKQNGITGNSMGITKVGWNGGINPIGWSQGFICQIANTTPENFTINYTTDIGQWNHYVCQYDEDTGKLSLYVNGDFYSDIDVIGTIRDYSDTFYLGGINGNAGGNFDVDELKIYSFTLTSEEVKIDYNRGFAQVMGSLSTADSGAPDSSAARKYCVPGDDSYCESPIGEWLLNEGTGSIARDTSGSGFDGTLMNDPAWVLGKVGRALEFDGTNYVNTVNTPHLTDGFTVCGWFNWSGTAAPNRDFIVSDHDSTGNDVNYSLFYSDSTGKLQSEFRATNDNWYVAASDTDIESNTWYHGCAVHDTNTLQIYLNGRPDGSPTDVSGLTPKDSSGVFSIAQAGSVTVPFETENTFHGTIDQVRLYDYARTPAQIAWEYNRGAPIGWWRFNECSGTTVYDYAPGANNDYVGNDGTIHIGPSGTNTSAGTCTSGDTSHAWYNGREGKFGSSLHFDGTDDYVDLGIIPEHQFSEDFTVSAWVSVSSFTSWRGIVTHMHASTNYGWGLTIDGDLNLGFHIHSGAYSFIPVDQNPEIGEWVHLLGVRRDGTNYVYLNGIQQTTTSTTSPPNTTTVPTVIGRWRGDFDGMYFNGMIDDVRIYNYALTEVQVREVYNYGAVRFGD